MSIHQIIKCWNDFWFARQTPEPLCILRIVYGVLALAYALQWLPELFIFFGPQGVASIKTMQAYEHLPRFSLLFMLPPTEQSVAWLWSALVASALLVIVGLRSRAALIVNVLCLMSFHHRNVLVLHSGDTFLRVLGMLLILAPVGAMYSLDAWLKRRKDATYSVPMTDVWPLRLIQLQIAALYCQTFWGKFSGNTWFDGTAVYYATRLEDFTRFPVPYLFDHLWTCQLLTWGALGIECALWTLIWVKELRYLVLLAGCMLHLGLEWSMNIPFFEVTMIAVFISFVEPRHIRMVLAQTGLAVKRALLKWRPAAQTSWNPALNALVVRKVD